MSRELREEVARALLIHRGLDPYSFFERWPHSTVVQDEADAILPIIAREVEAAKRETREACAVIVETVQFPDKVLSDNRSESGKFKRASRTSVNAQPPRRMLAAAIRGEPT